MSRKVEIPFTIRFVTPAFLGDANQSSEWRVPPFKHLLREWWRCLEMGRSRSSGSEHDAQELCRREALLFGGVHKDSPSRSQVEIMFEEEWSKGTLSILTQGKAHPHPEVKNKHGVIQNVDSLLYLGYGPLLFESRTAPPKLKTPPAIQAGDIKRAVIRCPSDRETEMRTILGLIHWLGTIGGRSRNGWGSLDILKDDDQPWCSRAPSVLEPVEKPWTDCLTLAWSHALGIEPASDGKPKRLLLWKTKSGYDGSWKDAMSEMARLKIALRAGSVPGTTRGAIPVGNNNCKPNNRHLMGYPITNHDKVLGWARLANQLRFKVIKDNLGDDTEPKYYGIAYHMPHGLPAAMQAAYPKGSAFPAYDQTVWTTVHTKLDALMTPWTTP
jgi:CRISPR-associated protein Cmr1